MSATPRRRLWLGPLAAAIGAVVLYGWMAIGEEPADATAQAPEPDPAPVPRAVAVPPPALDPPALELPSRPAPADRLAHPSAGQLEVRQLPSSLPRPVELQPIDPVQLRVDDPVLEGARAPMQRGRSNPRIGSPPVER